MDLTQLILVIAIVESAVQALDLYKEPKAIAAAVLGAAVLWFAEINVLVEAGIAQDSVGLQIVGVVVGALLAARGSQVAHELIKKLGV